MEETRMTPADIPAGCIQKDERPDAYLERSRRGWYYPGVACLAMLVCLFQCTYLHVMPISYQLLMMLPAAGFLVLLPGLTEIVFHRMAQSWPTYRKAFRIITPILYMVCYGGCLFMYLRYHTPFYITSIVWMCITCGVVCSLLRIYLSVSQVVCSISLFIGWLLTYSMLFRFNPIPWLYVSVALAGISGSIGLYLKHLTLPGFFVSVVTGLLIAVFWLMI